jgi:hypothetical protein
MQNEHYEDLIRILRLRLTCSFTRNSAGILWFVTVERITLFMKFLFLLTVFSVCCSMCVSRRYRTRCVTLLQNNFNCARCTHAVTVPATNGNLADPTRGLHSVFPTEGTGLPNTYLNDFSFLGRRTYTGKVVGVARLRQIRCIWMLCA